MMHINSLIYIFLNLLLVFFGVIDATKEAEFASPNDNVLNPVGRFMAEAASKLGDLTPVSGVKSSLSEENRKEHGADVTFPTHHAIADKMSPHHQRYRDHFLGSCRQKSDVARCNLSELYRRYRNLHVPRVKVNYTDAGYLKTKTPAVVHDAVMDLFDANKHKATREIWTTGKTQVNHWDSTPSLLSWERADVVYGGEEFRELLEAELAGPVERFINTGNGGSGDKRVATVGSDGQPPFNPTTVIPTAIYGIRVFKQGAMVAPHLDSYPLALTALVSVSQELKEPWPFEILDHSGKAVNVTLEPGEMLLYEGHSVVHGAPFPLVGKYAAFMYVHFMPQDYNSYNPVGDPDLLTTFAHLQPGTGNAAGLNLDDLGTLTEASSAVDFAGKESGGVGGKRPIPSRREINEHVQFIYNYEPQTLFLDPEDDGSG